MRNTGSGRDGDGGFEGPKAVPPNSRGFSTRRPTSVGRRAPSALQRLACQTMRGLYRYTVCKPISSRCRSRVGSMLRFGQPMSAAKPSVREGGAAAKALRPALLKLDSAGESSGRQRGKPESSRGRGPLVATAWFRQLVGGNGNPCHPSTPVTTHKAPPGSVKLLWWVSPAAQAQYLGVATDRTVNCSVNLPRADQGGYLVDPASSHMLVSKIKPCMSKYKLLIL